MGPMGFLGACSKQRFRYSIVSFVAIIGLSFKMKPTSRLKWRTENARDEKSLPAFREASNRRCHLRQPIGGPIS